MNEFAKYEEMRANGGSPHDVFVAAKADGVDSVRMLRLLRQVFGLSLADAKRATDAAEVWSEHQKVTLGENVYWEGWSSDEGFYLMQACVKGTDGTTVLLEGLKKFKFTNEGLTEVPVENSGVACVPVSHLKRPLSLRFKELLGSVENLSHVNSRTDSGRKAV